MSAKQLRIVVDTNVWVDSFCAGHPGGEDAKKFLAKACSMDALLLYPFHCLKDIFYILNREFRRIAEAKEGLLSEGAALAAREAAFGCMKNVSGLATAVGADASDVWLAGKYYRIHPDFEDDLVMCACRRAEADFLVTNDQKLIANADVVAKTPAQMLALLDLRA